MEWTYASLKTLAWFVGLSSGDPVNIEQFMQRQNAAVTQITQYHNIDLNNKEIQNKIMTNLKSENLNKDETHKVLDIIKSSLVFGCKNYFLNDKKILNKDITDNRCKNLPHIYYFNAHRQKDDWSCGYWSVFNAEAIERCLQNKLSIENGIINQRVQNRLDNDLNDNKKKVQATVEYINTLARELKLNKLKLHELKLNNISQNKLHILGIDDDNRTIRPFCFFNCQGIERRIERNFDKFDEIKNELLSNSILFFPEMKKAFNTFCINNNGTGALHFVCRILYKTGDKDKSGKDKKLPHWVLISIIKLSNRKPVLVIHDSAHFWVQSEFANYVSFLHNAFIS